MGKKNTGIDFNTSRIWDKISTELAAARQADDTMARLHWQHLAADFDAALLANDRDAMLEVRRDAGC